MTSGPIARSEPGGASDAALEGEVARMREELNAAYEKLAEAHKMASLGRLIAGIVHEINTPIGSILSNNEVTGRSLEGLKKLLSAAKSASSPPPDKALDVLDILASLAAVDKLACERIQSVIRSLKTYSRVEEGDLRKTQIHDLLENTIKLADVAFRRRITVVRDFGAVPEIECYPHLLNQVFLNLIVNAAQAIEGEGKVTVRTRTDGDSLVVSITDTGKGIRPEDRHKIFKPGFTTKPVGEGTGLGLSITRDIIVGTHGGSIDFESEPGIGATFHVRIPISQPRKHGN